MKEAAELRDPTEHYHAQPLDVSSPHHKLHLDVGHESIETLGIQHLQKIPIFFIITFVKGYGETNEFGNREKFK